MAFCTLTGKKIDYNLKILAENKIALAEPCFVMQCSFFKPRSVQDVIPDGLINRFGKAHESKRKDEAKKLARDIHNYLMNGNNSYSVALVKAKYSPLDKVRGQETLVYEEVDHVEFD